MPNSPLSTKHTGSKRQNCDNTPEPNKRQNIDTDEIANLSFRFRKAIAEKARNKKATKVNDATTRLTSADTALSLASSVLSSANNALRLGNETSQRSVANSTAFIEWIASAPTVSDELLQKHVGGAQASTGAY